MRFPGLVQIYLVLAVNHITPPPPPQDSCQRLKGDHACWRQAQNSPSWEPQAAASRPGPFLSGHRLVGDQFFAVSMLRSHSHSHILLCTLSSIFHALAAPAPSGDATCPCIDVFAGTVTVGGVSVARNDSCPWKADNGTCFQASYGSHTCGRHDLEGRVVTPSCAARSLDDKSMLWCSTPWCYVDADNCERPFATSEFFTSVLRDGKPLSYSYATCGYLDYYSRGELELRNLGRRLRISWPPIDSSTGYTKVEVRPETGETGVVDSTGRDTGQSGAIVRFMADLFAYYDLEWEYVPVSNESMMYSESVVTNCVHEVAVNRTDMCWFDSWLLDSRMELTTMVELFDDTFKVMVRVQGTESLSFADMLRVPFAPFTMELWLIIIGQYIVSSLVIFYMEGEYNDEDFPDTSARTALIQCIYSGCTAAFGGGMLLHPKSPPAKVVSVGLALSTLVFVSVYRAQVTTAMVEARLGQGVKGNIDSFEDGLARGATFCVYEFADKFIKARWPGISTLSVGSAGRVHELFDALHEGRCDASIIIDNWWIAAKAGVYSGPESPIFESVYAPHLAGEQEQGWRRFHCDDKIFPLPSTEAAWSIPNGMPVREELARKMRWAVKKAQDDPERQYANYASKYRATYASPAPGCKDAAAEGGQPASVAATVEDGVGATMISAITTVAALVMFGVTQLSQRTKLAQVERVASGSDSFCGRRGAKMTTHIQAALVEETVRRDAAMAEHERRMEAMQAAMVRRLDAIAGSLNVACSEDGEPKEIKGSLHLAAAEAEIGLCGVEMTTRRPDGSVDDS